MAEIKPFKTCHTINFTIMSKMRYAKPVTEIEVQAYLETHLLQGTFDTSVQPGRENYKDNHVLQLLADFTLSVLQNCLERFDLSDSLLLRVLCHFYLLSAAFLTALLWGLPFALPS